MDDMTPEDIAVLSQKDGQTLSEWWCALNRWMWPDQIPDPETAQRRLAEKTAERLRLADDVAKVANTITTGTGPEMIVWTMLEDALVPWREAADAVDAVLAEETAKKQRRKGEA